MYHVFRVLELALELTGRTTHEWRKSGLDVNGVSVPYIMAFDFWHWLLLRADLSREVVLILFSEAFELS